MLPALVICAALYAYHDSFRGPFIFDDLRAIPGNATIRRLGSAMSPPPRSAVTGRPIVNLSLALNYALGGLSAWGYHVVNLAIHILAALVLYGIVRRTLLSPGLRNRYGDVAQWLALAVALVWVVHPLQTESVTYIIQRTELLMGLFFLLTLYCVIRGFESSRPGAWYAGAVAASGLGMGSKEVMAVAPVVVLAYDRLFLSKSFRDAFRHRWSLYAGLAATWLIWGALVQTRVGRGIARPGFSEVTPWDYLKTQAGVIVHYLRLAFWPHPLVGDYGDWPLARSLTTVLPSAAVVMTLLGATVWAFHRRMCVAFLGVWFFLILAPTSSFWPIVAEVAVERRMYLPLAAVIVLVLIGGYAVLGEVWRRLGWQTDRRRVLGAVVLVATVAALARLTVRRTEDYRSAASFWSDIVVKRPNNARAHINLGDYLYKQGRVDEAHGHFSQAVRIKPSDAPAQYGLGVVLARQGKLEEAIAHYAEALRIDPNYAEAHTNLGVALAHQGKLKEAIAHYSEALRVAPTAGAHYNLATALARDGRTQEAIRHLEAALKLNPGHERARRSLADLTSSGAK